MVAFGGSVFCEEMSDLYDFATGEIEERDLCSPKLVGPDGSLHANLTL